MKGNGRPPEEPAKKAIVVYMHTVQPQPIAWLWPNHIPASKLFVLVGEPDLGKSTLTIDLACRISNGSPWPDGSGHAPRGITLMITNEDTPADIIRPRIDRQGGNPKRIAIITGIKLIGEIAKTERDLRLSLDLDVIEEEINDKRPQLVVIDPLNSYLGDIDTHKENEVRGALNPLARLCDKFAVCMIAVMHPSKTSGAKAIHRAAGSHAFGAAPRAVFGVAKDPQDKERRLFFPIKMNIAKKPEGLAYEFEDNGTLAWIGGVGDCNADELLGSTITIEDDEGLDAEGFLNEYLGPGNRARSEDVLREAKSAGVSRNSLYRAKSRLRIKSVRVEDHWYWYWPKEDVKTSQTSGQDAHQGAQNVEMGILAKTNGQSQLSHDFNQDAHFSPNGHLDGHLAPADVSPLRRLGDLMPDLEASNRQKSDDAIAARDDDESDIHVPFSKLPTKRVKKTKRR